LSKLLVMNRKPICSIKHFQRMIQSFKKISREQVDRNEYLTKHHFEQLNEFFNEPLNPEFTNDSVFHIMLEALYEKFKQNPYKTKSGFDWVYPTDGFILKNYKFWVSYTVQDNLGQRIKKEHLNDKFVVFKIHMQVDNHRKRRICSWSVPISSK